MAETQPTAGTDNGSTDVPDTTEARHYALLDHLPARLADDSYVQYLAQQADEARAQRDENRDKVFDLLHKGVALEGERNTLRAELTGIKGDRWTMQQVAAYTGYLFILVYFLAVFALPVVIEAVQS